MPSWFCIISYYWVYKSENIVSNYDLCLLILARHQEHEPTTSLIQKIQSSQPILEE